MVSDLGLGRPSARARALVTRHWAPAWAGIGWTHIVFIDRGNSIDELIWAHVQLSRLGVLGGILAEAGFALGRYLHWLLGANEGLLDNLLHLDCL